MSAAMKLDIETPALPTSRPKDRRKLTIIIACTANVCVWVIIHLVRNHVLARQEPKARFEPGWRAPDGLIEQQGETGPASSHGAYGGTCGESLVADLGNASFFSVIINQKEGETPSLPCLWVIQLLFGTNLRFTLDALDEDSHLNLYSEDQLTNWNASNYTRLNWTQVGSSFDFLGKSLVVVLPKFSASLAFSWYSIGNGEYNSTVAKMMNSDYSSSSNRLFQWGQNVTEEGLTWGIDLNEKFYMRWDVDAGASCGTTENCDCFYFAMFKLTSEGTLTQTVKTCGPSLEGQLKGIRGLVVAQFRMNAKLRAKKFDMSWGLDHVTEPTNK